MVCGGNGSAATCSYVHKRTRSLYAYTIIKLAVYMIVCVLISADATLEI